MALIYAVVVSSHRELEAVTYGDSDSCRHGGDPLITDIYSEFTACLQQLTQGAKVKLAVSATYKRMWL